MAAITICSDSGVQKNTCPQRSLNHVTEIDIQGKYRKEEVVEESSMWTQELTWLKVLVLKWCLSTTGVIINPAGQSHQRVRGVLAVRGGRLEVGLFSQQILKENTDTHLQRKQVLWFCTTALAWQRKVLSKAGKQSSTFTTSSGTWSHVSWNKHLVKKATTSPERVLVSKPFLLRNAQCSRFIQSAPFPVNAQWFSQSSGDRSLLLPWNLCP